MWFVNLCSFADIRARSALRFLRAPCESSWRTHIQQRVKTDMSGRFLEKGTTITNYVTHQQKTKTCATKGASGCTKHQVVDLFGNNCYDCIWPDVSIERRPSCNRLLLNTWTLRNHRHSLIFVHVGKRCMNTLKTGGKRVPRLTRHMRFIFPHTSLRFPALRLLLLRAMWPCHSSLASASFAVFSAKEG